MEYQYPTFEEVGITVPIGIKEDLFREGWNHSIRGGHLTDIKHHFKKSFRYGFREARLYLDYVRRQRGIIPFPMKGKMKTTCS